MTAAVRPFELPVKRPNFVYGSIIENGAFVLHCALQPYTRLRLYRTYVMVSITYVRKGDCLTDSHVSETASRVGRKKEWDERITLPITSAVLTRLDAAKREDETRLDIIRQAIESELKRRERTSPKPKP